MGSIYLVGKLNTELPLRLHPLQVRPPLIMEQPRRLLLHWVEQVQSLGHICGRNRLFIAPCSVLRGWVFGTVSGAPILRAMVAPLAHACPRLVNFEQN